MSVLYGDWDKLGRTLRKAQSSEGAKGFEDPLRKLGDALVRKLRGHIIKQDLDWAPLSATTIRKKGHGTVYLDRGHYIRGLEVDVSSKGPYQWGLQVTVKGSHYSGLPMATLARYLETGTSEIPARPIWRPVFAELKELPEFKDLMRHGVSLR